MARVSAVSFGEHLSGVRSDVKVLSRFNDCLIFVLLENIWTGVKLI